MFLARFFLKNVISTKRRVFALGWGRGCPVPGRAALCRWSLSSVCPRSPWVVFYFCGFQQLLGDPIPRDGSKDPHILTGAGSWQQPWSSTTCVGQLRRCPAWGRVRARGGADTFPPAPGDPAGLVRSPGAVSRWGPFQLPARLSLSPLVILFIFSDVGNEVMKSAPSEPGFNTAPCLGPGCFTSGAANPSLSSCQP